MLTGVWRSSKWRQVAKHTSYFPDAMPSSVLEIFFYSSSKVDKDSNEVGGVAKQTSERATTVEPNWGHSLESFVVLPMCAWQKQFKTN